MHQSSADFCIINSIFVPHLQTLCICFKAYAFCFHLKHLYKSVNLITCNIHHRQSCMRDVCGYRYGNIGYYSACHLSNMAADRWQVTRFPLHISLCCKLFGTGIPEECPLSVCRWRRQGNRDPSPSTASILHPELYFLQLF